jgi:putative aldouronate transport system substrate-binding protein
MASPLVHRPRVFTAAVIAIALMVALISGCSQGSGSSAAGGASGKTVSYPVKTKEKLTYWMELNAQNVAPNFKNIGDTEFNKQLTKETGIPVEYIHPAVGQGTQSFNLLVASNNMPDIVDYGWNKVVGGYPGGPSAAINNKIIVALGPYMDKDAPDYKRLLVENPGYDKMVKTDDAKYYIFGDMKLDDYLNTTFGLNLRMDWLKDLKLETPVTIDDWYVMLKAFKEKKGATAPLSWAGSGNPFYMFNNGLFIGAYGVTKGLYTTDGKVKFGPYEPGYRDWLTTMNKWYKEGLFDNNFATNDQKAYDANVINGKTGAVPTWPGSGLGKFIPALKTADPKAQLAPVQYPVLNKGDKPQFNSLLNAYDGGGACITAKAKNPSLAAQFLNYGYTQKGRVTWNYGIEGVSYTTVNGVVKMTPEVVKNPKGLPVGQAWSIYSRGVYPGPYFSEKHFLEEYYIYQEQKDALTIWTQTDMKKHLMPPVSPTPEESAEHAKIMNDINSYVDEFTLKAIMGTEDIKNFDKYIAQLKKLKMDRALEIQQSALDRYNKR